MIRAWFRNNSIVALIVAAICIFGGKQNLADISWTSGIDSISRNEAWLRSLGLPRVGYVSVPAGDDLSARMLAQYSLAPAVVVPGIPFDCGIVDSLLRCGK